MKKILPVIILWLLCSCNFYKAAYSQSGQDETQVLFKAGWNPAFSIVILPDTQYYSLSGNTFAAQTRWIVNNRKALNIKFVAHMGDITQQNITSHWNVASAAYTILDNANIPYGVNPGNHDYYPSNEIFLRNSAFSRYFGASRFSGKSWYGGAYNSLNENSYCLFESGTLKFLALNLEFLPRKDVVAWANQVIKNHPDRRVMISTHSYMNSNAEYTSDQVENYNTVGCDGDDLWRELVSRHKNVFLVLCGHMAGSATRIQTGNNRNPVIEMLTDFQYEGSDGNGWLKVLKFNPANNTITVESLSVTGAALGPAVYYKDLNHTLSYNMRSAVKNEYTIGSYLYADRTVNAPSTGQQEKPAIVCDQTGNTFITWMDDSDGDDIYQIKVRGFNKDGEALFSQQTVKSVADGRQSNPVIACSGNGNFVVAWEDDQDENGEYQIKARGFNVNGTQSFADITVNPVGSGQQRNPAIAMDKNGDFVVAWEDDQDQNGSYQILARGFNTGGAQRFATITVNSVFRGQQLDPDISMHPENGTFVVAWEDDQDQNGSYQILVRGFNANGTQRFADIPVNTVSSGQQLNPSVAQAANGYFIVAWQDDQGGNGNYRILTRGFNADGTQRFAAVTVNNVSGGRQYYPDTAITGNGSFVVVWQDDQDNNDRYQILVRGFNADGTERLAGKTVNSWSSGRQYAPAVAIDPDFHFTTTWQDDRDQDGAYDIISRNLQM